MSSSTELANLPRLGALPQQPVQQSYSPLYNSATTIDTAGRIFGNSFSRQEAVPKRKNIDDSDSDEVKSAKKIKCESFSCENSDDFSSLNSQTSSPWSEHSTGVSPSFNVHVSNVKPSPNNAIDGVRSDVPSNERLSTHSDSSEASENLPVGLAQVGCSLSKQGSPSVELSECQSSLPSNTQDATSTITSSASFDNGVDHSVVNGQEQSSSMGKTTINGSPMQAENLTHSTKCDIKDRDNQIHLTESLNKLASTKNSGKDIREASSSQLEIPSSEAKLHKNAQRLQLLEKLRETGGKKRVVVGNFYKAILDKTPNSTSSPQPMKFMYWVYVIGEGCNLADYIKSVTYTLPDSYAPKNVLTIRSPFEVIGPSTEEFQLTLRLNPLKRKFNKPSRLRYTIKLGNRLDPDAYSGQWRIGHETLYTVSLVDVPSKLSSSPHSNPQPPIFSPAFLPPTYCVAETDQLVIPFYSSANDISDAPSQLSGIPVVNINVSLIRNPNNESTPLSAIKSSAQNTNLANCQANPVSTSLPQLTASSASSSNPPLGPNIVPTGSAALDGGCRESSAGHDALSYAMAVIGFSDSNNIAMSGPGVSVGADFSDENFSCDVNAGDDRLMNRTLTSAQDDPLSAIEQKLSHDMLNHEKLDSSPLISDIFGLEASEDMRQDTPWSNFCPNDEENRISGSSVELLESGNISSFRDQSAMNTSFNGAEFNFVPDPLDSATMFDEKDLLEFLEFESKRNDNSRTSAVNHTSGGADTGTQAAPTLNANSSDTYSNALDELIKDVESRCLSNTVTDNPLLFVPKNFLQCSPNEAKEGFVSESGGGGYPSSSEVECHGINGGSISQLQDPLAGHPWEPVEKKLSLVCNSGKRNLVDSTNEVLMTSCASKRLRSSENPLAPSAELPSCALRKKQQATSESVTRAAVLPYINGDQSTTFGDVLEKLNQRNSEYDQSGFVNLANAQTVNSLKFCGGSLDKEGSKSFDGNSNGLGSVVLGAQAKNDYPADDSDDEIQILSVVKKAPPIRHAANLPQAIDQISMSSSAAISLNAVNKPEISGAMKVPSTMTRVTAKPVANFLRCFNPSRLKMVKLGQEGDPALKQLVASIKKSNANNILRSEQVFRPAQPIQITTASSAAGKTSSATFAKLVKSDATNVVRVPTSNVIIQTSSTALKNFPFKTYSNVKSLPMTVTPATLPLMPVMKNVSVPQTSSAKLPIKNITVKTNGKDFTIPVVQGKNFINANVKTQMPVFKMTTDGKLLKSTQNPMEKLTPAIQSASAQIPVASKLLTTSVGENLTFSVPCSLPSVVSYSVCPASSTLANSNTSLKNCSTSSQNSVSVSVLSGLGSLGSTVKSVQVCSSNSARLTNGNTVSTTKPVQIPRAIASVSEYPSSSVPSSLKPGNLISSVTVLPRRTVMRPTGQNGKFNLISVSNFQNLPLGTKIQLDPVSTDTLLTNGLLTSTVNQRSVSTSTRVNINKSAPVQTLQPIKIDVSKSEPETLCGESTSLVVSTSDIAGRDLITCNTVNGITNVDNTVSGDAGDASQACVASCSSLPSAPCVVSSKDFISPTASPALMNLPWTRDSPPLEPVHFSPACAITHKPEFLTNSTASCDVIVDESCALPHQEGGSHQSLACVSVEKCELTNEESVPVTVVDTSASKKNQISFNSSSEVPVNNNDPCLKNEAFLPEQLSPSVSVLSKEEKMESCDESDNKSVAGSSIGSATRLVEESNSSDADRSGEIKNNYERGVPIRDSAPVVMRESAARIPTDFVTTKNVIYVNSGEKSVKFAQVLNENHNSKLPRDIKDPSKIMLKHADLNMNLLSKLDGSGQKLVLSRPALGSPLVLNGRKLYRIMPVSAVSSLASLKKISASSILTSGKNTPVGVKEETFVTNNSSSVQPVTAQFGRLKKGTNALTSQQLTLVAENKFGKSGVCAAVNSFLQTRDNKSDVLRCVTLDSTAAACVKRTSNGVVQCDENDPDLDSLTQEELANLSKYRRDKLEDQKREKLLKNIPLLQSACGEDHQHCNPSMFIRLAVRAFPLFRPDIDPCSTPAALAGDERVLGPQKMLHKKKMSQIKHNNSFSKSKVKNNCVVSNSSVYIKEEISDAESLTTEENFSDLTKCCAANAKSKKTCFSAATSLKTDASKNLNSSTPSSSESSIDVLAPHLVVHLVRDSRQQFLRHSLMKQRALEYLRARAVLQHMRNWCELCASLWSLRAVVAWARQNGYTPCPLRPDFLKSDWFIPEARLGYLHYCRLLQKKTDESKGVWDILRPGSLQAFCEEVFSEERTTVEANNADETKHDIADAVGQTCSSSRVVFAWDQIVLSKSSNLMLSASGGTSAALTGNRAAPNTPVTGPSAVTESASPLSQVSIKKECPDEDDDSVRAGSLPCVSSLWDTFSDLVIGGHSSANKDKTDRLHNNSVPHDFPGNETTMRCGKSSHLSVPSSETNTSESRNCSDRQYEMKPSIEAPLSLDAACAEVRRMAGLTQHRLTPHCELLPPASDCDPVIGNKKAVLADTPGLVLFKCLSLFLEDLLRSSLAVSWSSKCKSRLPQPETASALGKNMHQTCPPETGSQFNSDSFSLKNSSASAAVTSRCKNSTVGSKGKQKLESRVASASKNAGRNKNSANKKSLLLPPCNGSVSELAVRSKTRDCKGPKLSPRNFKQRNVTDSVLSKNNGRDVRSHLNPDVLCSKSIVGNRGRLSSTQRTSARNAKRVDSMSLNETELYRNRGILRKAQPQKRSAKRHARPSMSSCAVNNKHSSGKVRAKVMTQPTNLLKARMVNSMRGAPTKGLRRKLTTGYHLPGGVLKDEDRRRLSSCGPVKEITTKHVLRALLYTRPQFKIIGSKVLAEPHKK